MLTVEEIARITHETNRAYCAVLGDVSQVAWADAPEWQRASAIRGVRAIIAGVVTAPAASHASWLAEKERDGWVYGPVKSANKKEHPCMVPYEQLPPEQRLKDALFYNIASILIAASSPA